MTRERHAFRQTIGIIAILGGFAATAGLFFVKVPESQIDPLLVVLGIVLGWGGNVINGEWGSSPAGRKAAERGLQQGGDDAGTI